MYTEKKVKINPSMLESDLLDSFQDQLLSKFLSVIKTALKPHDGKPLDAMKTYVKEFHSVAFTEQYTYDELLKLQTTWKDAIKAHKTTLTGPVIRDLLSSVQTSSLGKQRSISASDNFVVFHSFDIVSPGFTSIFHAARTTGVLPNYLHSLFLPDSRLRDTIVPKCASPFFMIASGLESRSMVASSAHKEALGESSGSVADGTSSAVLTDEDRKSAETIWNLVLHTPVGSRLFCVSRVGQTAELSVSMMASTIDGESDLGEFAHMDTRVLIDPNKEYKKFLDGETPLHPMFFPLTHPGSLQNPEGPLSFLFEIEEGGILFNETLSRLVEFSSRLSQLEPEAAAAEIFSLAQRGAALRGAPNSEDFRLAVEGFISDNLSFFSTPEALLECLMCEAFIKKPADFRDRVLGSKLTPEEKVKMIQAIIAADFTLGVLQRAGIIDGR